MKKETVVFAFLLVLVSVASRLIPHPQNFTAALAVALFSGSLWQQGYLRFLVPLGAMLVTDLFLGIYPSVGFTYIAIALCISIAPTMKESFWGIAGRGLTSTLLFYIISNLGVWMEGTMYAPTAEGLWECYLMGIPFIKNILLSTWLYSFVLYSTYRLLFAEQGFAGFLNLNYGRQK